MRGPRRGGGGLQLCAAKSKREKVKSVETQRASPGTEGNRTGRGKGRAGDRGGAVGADGGGEEELGGGQVGEQRHRRHPQLRCAAPGSARSWSRRTKGFANKGLLCGGAGRGGAGRGARRVVWVEGGCGVRGDKDEAEERGLRAARRGLLRARGAAVGCGAPHGERAQLRRHEGACGRVMGLVKSLPLAG